ncbi:MAG: choice-of-anchor D domain-containing protein [Candidatus Acidiferrales bacterium]
MIRNSFAIVAFAATLITSGCVGTTGKGTVGGGNGAGTMAISVSPATINFGSIAVGTGWMQPVTVTNDGTKPVTISKISVSGTGFTIGGLAAPATLAAGQTAQVDVAFKASASGASTGAVTISSNADDPTTTIPLNGQGVSSSLALSPDSINFGSVAMGTTATQTVKITNSGSASATISNVSVTGNGVTLSGLTLPATVAAGQSASVTATFKPTSTSTESGALTVTASGSSSPLTADWTGSGNASALTITPSSVSFGNVTVGSDATQTIKLANSGSATITISSLGVSGSGMSASGLTTPYTLGAGKSATFTAQFKPTSAASNSGAITIDSNAASNSASIPLSGKGVTSNVALSPNTTSLSFGSVKSGSAATQAVTITSTGNANANISSVSVSGTGFSLSGSGSAETLTPNQSAQFTVNFDPKSSGNATGTLSITSNAPNSPLQISLSGSSPSASPNTSHSVALNWDASSSSVVGYYVYRGSKPSGPYSKLNGSPNSSTSYSDSSVSDGQVYYYVVTAVNSNNVESADSNQVSATIPSNKFRQQSPRTKLISILKCDSGFVRYPLFFLSFV